MSGAETQMVVVVVGDGAVDDVVVVGFVPASELLDDVDLGRDEGDR